MGLRVLSLFDGIACGMQAFKELKIPIDVYYASEIEKNAIKVAKANHPEIIEIGDVTEIDFKDYVGKVDIIIGGSPCQGFSVMGKQLAFLDERSALIKYFFEAVETIKPKYFFLENVVMQKQYEKNISDILGVDAIRIDAAKVSMTQRVRLYWTNIPNVKQPEQIKGLVINSMSEECFRDTTPEKPLRREKENLQSEYEHCYRLGYTSNKKSGCQAVYDAWGKYPTILTNGNKRVMLADGSIKFPTIQGYECIHGLPKDYTKAAGWGGERIRIPLVGNGWCIPVIKYIFSFIPKEDYNEAD